MTDAIEPREATESEVIQKRSRRKLTLEQFLARALPVLAARIWETCCWPDRMEGGWKIGDYNFLILSTCPDAHTDLYVQYWSEPLEGVVVEVCSGEWNPGAVRYVRPERVPLLETRGFARDDEGPNFRKEVRIATRAHAEAAAREALQIFFEVFGYRGATPLVAALTRAERAEHAPVYTSVTPEDLQKLLHDCGFRAVPGTDPDEGVVRLVSRGSRRFVVQLHDPVPGNNLYTHIRLVRQLRVKRVPVDFEVSWGRSKYGVVEPLEDMVVLRTELSLLGGVTEQWLRMQFAIAERVAQEAQRRLNHAGRRPAAAAPSGAVVH